MTDFYLRFNSKQQAHSVLYNEDKTPKFEVIDDIGVIYEMIDSDEFVALDGYHVNIRVLSHEDDGPLRPYAVIPKSPTRVFA